MSDIHTLIHNCPNCGGELTEKGDCKYCNTKIRLENRISVDTSKCELIEIELRIKRGDTICITPIKGFIESIDYQIPVLDCAFLPDYYTIPTRQNIRLTIVGDIYE